MSVKYINRTISRIDEHLIKVESLSHVSGKKTLRDVTGPFFRLIFTNILTGKFIWNIEGEYFSPTFNRVGLYIPQYSISEDTAIDCSHEGYMYLGEQDLGVFNLPILFDMKDEPFPILEHLNDIKKFLNSIQQPIIISRSINPHKISNDCKVFINHHFKEDLKIEEIAQNMKVGNSRMTKYFKKDFGMTPVQYRRALRVEYGLFLIAKGMPIVDAAFICGYNDLGRFYKQFKDVYYQSPGSLIHT